jgi:hypothetical protein
MFAFKNIESTRSHRSFVYLHGSFSIFRRGIIMTFNIGSVLGAREFSFANFPRCCTITIACRI